VPFHHYRWHKEAFLDLLRPKLEFLLKYLVSSSELGGLEDGSNYLEIGAARLTVLPDACPLHGTLNFMVSGPGPLPISPITNYVFNNALSSIEAHYFGTG
jgi:hypothetical protein